MTSEHPNIATTRRYLRAIEENESPVRFYAPDAVQEELPNRLNPAGARRDVAAIADAAERGRRGLLGQRFEIRSAMASGNQVAMELVWTGTLAAAVGSIRPGGEMRAHFAMFLEFRDGLIVAQRNYDCFEEF